jgi:hypothetical protein
MLKLRKDAEFKQGEGYSVIFDGRGVGRIFLARIGAPKDRAWFWGAGISRMAAMQRATIWKCGRTRSCDGGI